MMHDKMDQQQKGIPAIGMLSEQTSCTIRAERMQVCGNFHGTVLMLTHIHSHIEELDTAAYHAPGYGCEFKQQKISKSADA